MTLWSTAEESAILKLTATVRYLEEQLSEGGVDILPSRDCLKDLALDATDRTRRQSEPYITCVCRHLNARVRFILWTSTDGAFDRAVWPARLGRNRPRVCSAAPMELAVKFPAGR